ncbi:MAG: radical SAM protein, partial [Geobacteraceae bacterium]|nr:radical SAM protein [Geobacteraceae bacterium]
ATMAASLIRAGHRVRILDADAEGLSPERIFELMREEKPDVAIITVSLVSLKGDCNFARELRLHGLHRVFLKTGITYPDLLKGMLEESRADLCIIGECDLAIEDILVKGDRKGTAWLKEGELRTGQPLIVDDMDRLPLPARQLLPNGKYRYVLLGESITTMQTSRGCPYPCSFYCAYPLVQGKRWRARSPKHVLAEIEDIVGTYGIRRILFRDATFTLDRERTREICERIVRGGHSLRWWCETRVDRLDFDLMKIMKEAGCMGMNLGVETGDEDLMQSHAKIGLTLEKLQRVTGDAGQLGLRLHFLLMIGLPHETKESIYRTYRLIGDLKPSSFGVSIVTPYPGTDLYAQALERGWLEIKDWRRYGGHEAVMRTDHLSREDLLQAQEMMNRKYVLLNKGWIGELVSKLLDRKFRKWASI